MFRNGGSDDVVQAEKAVDERCAVERVHRAVPGGGDDEEAKDSERVEDQFQVIFPAAERRKEEEKEPRQNDSDRAFGQDRQSGKDIGQADVERLRLGQRDSGEEHGSRREEKEHLIRNDGFADDPDGNGRSRHGSHERCCRRACRGASYVPGAEDDGCGAEQGRRQTGGKVGNSEQRIGQADEPVDKNRLVIPGNAVNVGRNPVAGKDHFFRREGIIGFNGVGNGQIGVAGEEKEEREECHEEQE